MTKEEIESLGFKYDSGNKVLSWYRLIKTIQPFSITYRSFLLTYTEKTGRLRIVGFEYPNFESFEEPLFEGKIDKIEDLKFILEKIGILEE